MKKLSSPYFWFKAAVLAGLSLAVLLLVQSIVGYLHVSRRLIVDQSVKEAESKIASLEQELRRAGTFDPSSIRQLVDETQQGASNKIAWITVINSSGQALAHAGLAAEAPKIAPNPRATPEDIRTPQVREVAGRKVMVTLLPLRFRRPRAGPEIGPARENPPGPPPQANAAVPPSGPRFIEMAIYMDSVAAAFGSVQRDLIVSCLAAMGLAGAVIFLWLQFPRYLRGKQLEQQLELARRVQTDLLPAINPVFEHWDISASCVPALQVGGDFYDAFLTDRGCLALVLGDVSGKGIPAALLMGLIHGAVRSTNWSDSAEDHESSSRRLNDLLNSRTSPERFASLFWAYFDPKNMLLQYINAGQLPPAVIRRTNGGEFRLERLNEGGPILGIVAHADYKQGSIQLHPGDTLILFSDGIIEAANGADEEFGEERLWEAVRDNWTRTAAEIRDVILERVRVFLQTIPPQDDMTLMVIRVCDGAILGAGPGSSKTADARDEKPQATLSNQNNMQIHDICASGASDNEVSEPLKKII